MVFSRDKSKESICALKYLLHCSLMASTGLESTTLGMREDDLQVHSASHERSKRRLPVR
jgi:hypothetical protein